MCLGHGLTQGFIFFSAHIRWSADAISKVQVLQGKEGPLAESQVFCRFSLE